MYKKPKVCIVRYIFGRTVLQRRRELRGGFGTLSTYYPSTSLTALSSTNELAPEINLPMGTDDIHGASACGCVRATIQNVKL